MVLSPSIEAETSSQKEGGKDLILVTVNGVREVLGAMKAPDPLQLLEVWKSIVQNPQN